MLALHGFDVVGLELSSKGADVARAYTAKELSEPHEYNFGTLEASDSEGPGSITILSGDFFDRAWSNQKFDLIYDYTVSPPSISEHWTSPKPSRSYTVLNSILSSSVPYTQTCDKTGFAG